MPKRISFRIANADLVSSEVRSDRLVHETRFVPLKFQRESFLGMLSRVTNAARSAQVVFRNTGLPIDGQSTAVEVEASSTDAAIEAATQELGILFLERTRMRLKGLAIGEQIYSMSLAPGEEVTVEQKTFSERQTILEEVSEQATDFQTEFSSTLTSELQNSFSKARSENQSKGWSFGTSMGGSWEPSAKTSNDGPSVKAGNVRMSVDIGYSDTVAKADNVTRQRSVRNSQSASNKAAATLRSQHKITFKVSETTRLEATAKRVIRNPNPYTPIDLVYFKMMQQLDMTHERYGVRLCWAPHIDDPGALKRSLVKSALTKIYNEEYETVSWPAAPQRPLPPGVPPAEPIHVYEELTVWQGGTMNDDQVIAVDLDDSRYVWDGDLAAMNRSLSWSVTNWGDRPGPPSVTIRAVRRKENALEVLVHGYAENGPANSKLYAIFDVELIPNSSYSDPDYVAALQEWQQAQSDWRTQVKDVEAATRLRIATRSAEWLVEFERDFDPVETLLQFFVRAAIPQQKRDSFGEVSLWSNIFDLENAAVKILPGWWTDPTPRDPLRDLNGLENASWAQLYLPIRIGCEELALKWLYGTPLVVRGLLIRQSQDGLENAITTIVKDITDYRSANFGGPDEIKSENDGSDCPSIKRPFICLGKWTEVIPTDGTHIEVIQAGTTAADDFSSTALDDAHKLSLEMQALKNAQAKMTAAVLDTDSATINVHIGTMEPR